MPELPIVVEPTVSSYLLWAALGGGIVLTILHDVWKCHQKERLPNLTVTAIVVFPVAALGIFLMLQPVGWSWRIDETGMTLHAPFEIFRAKGSIAWADVTDVRVVVARGRRSAFTQLEIEGQHGSLIEIDELHTMPKSFAALLVAAVEHYAPHAKLSPDAKGFIESLVAALETEPLNPLIVTFSSYRVRVGDHVLK